MPACRPFIRLVGPCRRPAGRRQCGCLQADPDHMTDQTDDVAGVIVAVGVGADTRARVLGDAVLVDDPLKGGAIAEAVLERVGWDAGEGEGGVDRDGGLVLTETHLSRTL